MKRSVLFFEIIVFLLIFSKYFVRCIKNIGDSFIFIVFFGKIFINEFSHVQYFQSAEKYKTVRENIYYSIKIYIFSPL